MLKRLRVAKYRFTPEAREPLTLPRYKGSTLRGGFGAVFKRCVCVQPGNRYCQNCLLKHVCSYPYIFETPLPPDSEVLRSLNEVPRPFVIEPPLETKTSYQPGDRLEFGLVLVGKAIEYLPYFVVVFRELGNQGLGRGRGKYLLGEVSGVNPLSGEEELIYSSEDEMVRQCDLAIGFDDIAGALNQNSSNELEFHFLTPTRLKAGGRYISEPDFHILIRNLMRRISSLYYFHCGEQWEYDFRGAVARARGVETEEMDTRWVEWERYSRRQEARIEMGGFVGRAVYRGEVESFLSLLKLGEIMHVGKATVFGNGQYVLGNGEVC